MKVFSCHWFIPNHCYHEREVIWFYAEIFLPFSLLPDPVRELLYER